MAGDLGTERMRRVTVLAGGVGAARFLRGLCPLLDPRRVTIVVNTGDDETFFGLHISPDLDTVTYTLAGRVDRRRGWGVAGDTSHSLQALGSFYPETWFQLGDRDLATHVFRTDALRHGRSLSWVAATVASCLGVRQTILPMTNDPVRTIVHVGTRGPLPFQRYLVKHGARGRVESVRFAGIRAARPAPGVVSAIRRATAIIIPPSNPVVSILPILSLPGVRPALAATRARVAAVSPIVRGRPIRGPLHRMLAGLGHEVSAVGVARIYQGLADVFVLDRRDARLARRIEALGMQPVVTDTIMRSQSQSRALAATVIAALSK